MRCKMIKSIVMKLAKKYILSAVNDLLMEYKEDVNKVTTTLNLWIERLEKVMSLLRRIGARVDDGKIDDEEIEVSVDELSDVIKSW